MGRKELLLIIVLSLTAFLRISDRAVGQDSQPICHVQEIFSYECIYDLKTGYSERFKYHVVDVEFVNLLRGAHNITTILETQENLMFINVHSSIVSQPTNCCRNGEVSVNVTINDNWCRLRIGLNETQTFIDPVDLVSLPYGQNVHILNKNGQLSLAFWFNTSDLVRSCEFSLSPQRNVKIEDLEVYTDLNCNNIRCYYSGEAAFRCNNVLRGNHQIVANTLVNDMWGTIDVEVTTTQDELSMPIKCYVDGYQISAQNEGTVKYSLSDLGFFMIEEPFFYYMSESEYCLNFTASEEFLLRMDAKSREEIDYLVFDIDPENFTVTQTQLLGEPCYQFVFRVNSSFNCYLGLKLKGKHWFISPKTMRLDTIPTSIKERFLKASSSYDGKYFDINDPFVQRWAKHVVANETNPYIIANTIYQNITKTLEYPPDWKTREFNESVSQILKDRIGVCRHYARAYAALCICSGLPARTVVGTAFSTPLNETWKKNHEWVEVYLPGCGWVTIDPTWDHTAKHFCCLSDRHAKLTYWTYLVDTLNVAPVEPAFRTKAKENSKNLAMRLIQYCRELLKSESLEIENAEVLLDKAATLSSIGSIHAALHEIAKAYLLITNASLKPTSPNNGLVFVILGLTIVASIVAVYIIRTRIISVYRNRFQFLLIVVSVIIMLTEVVAITRLVELPTVSKIGAVSTLNSILVLIGPLLGVVGAFTAFLYKGLDDRRMNLEETLLREYSRIEDETQESIRDQIDGRISEIKSELERAKINTVLMFSFFLATIISCFFNKDYVPEYLEASAVRLVVPEAFLLVSVVSIVLLILSFRIPEVIDPTQGLNQANRSAPSDPYGSIIRSFLAIEEATRDFLARRDRPIERYTAYSVLQDILSQIDKQIGNEFGYFRKIRNNVVHGRTVPDLRLAIQFNKRGKEYLEMLRRTLKPSQ